MDGRLQAPNNIEAYLHARAIMGNEWRYLNGQRRQDVEGMNMLIRDRSARLRCLLALVSLVFSQQICPRAGLVTISGYNRVPDLGRPDSLKVPPLAGLLGSRVPFVTHLSLSLLGVGRQRRSCFLFSCLQAFYGLDGRRRHTRAVCCWRRWRRVPGEAVRRVLMTPQGPPGVAEGWQGR